MAALAATALVVAPSALAQKPVIVGMPAMFIGGPEGTGRPQTPPAVAQIGDTLYSSEPTAICDPSCDPTNPDADPTVGNREVFPSASTGPAGLFWQFEKCDNPDHCLVVQPKSTKNTYVVQPSDAGWMLHVVFMVTNLDCAYPRSYDQYQSCRWDTESVPSLDMTPVVPPLPPVALAPAALPDGAAGKPYSQALFASNGTGPYRYSVASGTLPTGLTLSQSGSLTGTPTTGGSFTFTVQATAAGASPGTQQYTIRVGLTLGPSTLAAGTTGQPYSQKLTATGANAPTGWTVSTGALPTGLTIGADGVLSGTPTQAGNYSFTVTATDAAAATGSASYSVTVGYPTLIRFSSKLPAATIGVAYRARLAVTGGSAPYTFALKSGALPLGLRLARNGTISGAAQGPAERSTFQVLVRDRYGAQGRFTYRLAVVA